MCYADSTTLRCKPEKKGPRGQEGSGTMISTEIRATTTRVTTMKAIVQERYGTSEVLELRDIDKPVIGEGEVLVRVRAAGVNPADWAIVGCLPCIARPIYGRGKPKNRVRGTDVAGEVEAVGASVTRFRPGDAVFGWCGHLGGAFAEYVSVSEDALVPKPANLTFEQAAAVPMAGTVALLAVRDYGKVQAGQKVLINGASGGVGTFAVQIAKSLGADVTGVCSTRNVDLVRSLGADHVIDYTKEDFAKGAERYDVILDNVPNHSLSECRHILSPKGKYVMIGGGGPNDSRWVGPFGRLIHALLVSPFIGQEMGMMMADANQKDLTVLADLMQSGKVKPVIDRTYKLSEVPAAIAYLEEGHARAKVVITLE